MTEQSVRGMGLIRRVKTFSEKVVSHLKSDRPLSRQSIPEVIAFYIQIASGPMVMAFCLGIAMLYLDDKADTLLSAAMKEFLQLTGLKLCGYLTLIFSGIGLIFYKIPKLGVMVAWPSSALAMAGFTFASVISGVFIGLSVPVWMIEKSFAEGFNTFVVGMTFAGFCIYFFLVSHLTDSRHRESATEVFGEYTTAVAIVLGFALVVYGGYGLDVENWLEVYQ